MLGASRTSLAQARERGRELAGTSGVDLGPLSSGRPGGAPLLGAARPLPHTKGRAMKLYRCRICGETYLGHGVPTECPFCGADAEYIVLTEDYPEDVNDVQLTEVERADLETSIELETSNTRFYLAMAARKDNPKLSSAYKRLARVEAEHCSVFSKLAKMPKPADLLEPGEELGTWEADIDESLRRENLASALYAEFAGRATSPRLREIWSAVSRVEETHIELDGVAKGYI